jgi:hypothetical protein
MIVLPKRIPKTDAAPGKMNKGRMKCFIPPHRRQISPPFSRNFVPLSWKRREMPLRAAPTRSAAP